MKVILDILLLLVGFLFLIKGADFFVDGSVAVARRLKVPSIVVGLTIVAVGTSLPELAVSAFASAISGIIRVENDAKNIDGKFKIGSAIPFIIPNIDNDEAVEEPYLLSASGINKSSIVLSPVWI